MSRDLAVFFIGEREFCIDTLAVRDIRPWSPATPLPHSPRHIQSAISVGSALVPLIDMSLRLGLGRSDPARPHTVILVRLNNQPAALLVDAACGTVNVETRRIRTVAGMPADHRFIGSVVVLEDRMICLVELNALIGELESEAA